MGRRLLLLLRLGLAALFILSGALKLMDPTGFASDIANYQLLPALSPWLAVVLPAVEIVAGLALVVAPRSWRGAAALVIAGLSAMFVGAAGWAVAQGVDVSCGCFGGGSSTVTSWTVLRNLGLLAIAALVLALDTRAVVRR